jgi:sulfate adenylyltransferase large subunit
MGARDEVVVAETDLLRFIAAGSVDDGKSTLIGRLLYDSKGIFDDQLDAVAGASRRRGRGELDLSLLTDGLVAEREQGITIDVAYRYFATPRRKFIIADTPGHVQYTRNMVTAASTADLAIVLVDARHGVLTQTRRHTYLASLLGIAHIVFAVNKMDLVGFDRARFEALASELAEFSGRLRLSSVDVIPVSALDGDNVVSSSDRMPWYQGPALLGRLEQIPVQRDRAALPLRFPVQGSVRPTGTQAGSLWHDFRGIAGRVESGRVAVGDPVAVLPSGVRTRISAIHTYDGTRPSATAGESVMLELADDVDVSRGDIVAGDALPPAATTEFDALLCWFAASPLDRSRRLVLKAGTKTVKAKVVSLDYRVDVDRLAHDPRVEALHTNDIARAKLRVAQPLALDAYAANRATGSFVLIDEATNDTVAGGMVVDE